MHVPRIIFLYLLTAWITFVALRIEVLNVAAGHLLPTDAFTRNKARGGSGKWRAVWMNETRWRTWNIRDAKGGPDPRPLTSDEQSQMLQEIKKANADYDLHEFLSYFGWMWQYVAILIVLLLGAAWAIDYRRERLKAALYALPTLVAIAAGALAVYRGYFTSLASGI